MLITYRQEKAELEAMLLQDTDVDAFLANKTSSPASSLGELNTVRKNRTFNVNQNELL